MINIQLKKIDIEYDNCKNVCVQIVIINYLHKNVHYLILHIILCNCD